MRRLNDRQTLELAKDLFHGEHARTEARERPVAILMAGQSGAGKSTIANELRAELVRRGGSVLVDADAVRPALPYYDALDPGVTNVATATQADAGRVAQAIGELAVKARRNLVVVGTLRDHERALETAQALRASGYKVELHAVAVHEQISELRATQRELKELASGEAGRNVPGQWHGESYSGSARSVRRLEHAGAVDRVVVYNRLGDAIHDAQPQPGDTQAATVLDSARRQLTNFERITLARDWLDVAGKLAATKPENDLSKRATHHAERAHYGLRSVPEAAEAYDYSEPTNAQVSRELADRYGQKLQSAFQRGETEKSSAYPELLPAFAAHKAAMAFAAANPRGMAAAEAFSQRIAVALRAGEKLPAVQVRSTPAASRSVEPER